MNYVGLVIQTSTGSHKVVAHDEPRFDQLARPQKRVRFNAVLDNGERVEVETSSLSWILRGVS